MKKQFLLAAAALSLTFSMNGNAAILDQTSDNNLLIIDGDAPNGQVLVTPITNDVIGAGVSGWTWAELVFGSGSQYLFEYVGKEASNHDSLQFVLSGSEINNKGLTASVEESAAVADSWFFAGCDTFADCDIGDAEIAANNSPYIWMAIDPADSRSVLLAYDDVTRDGDFDDLVIRVSAIPVPAAVWLFGTAMLGLFGLRRKSKAGALAA